MGIQTTMVFGNKQAPTVNVIASGGASFPVAGRVAIATIIDAPEEYRLADIQRAVKILINHARDNNLFSAATPLAVVITLDGGKAAIRTETAATGVVTGDVALMLSGQTRLAGSRNFVEEAHKQLLDWMRENQRLAA